MISGHTEAGLIVCNTGKLGKGPEELQPGGGGSGKRAGARKSAEGVGDLLQKGLALRQERGVELIEGQGDGQGRTFAGGIGGIDEEGGKKFVLEVTAPLLAIAYRVAAQEGTEALADAGGKAAADAGRRDDAGGEGIAQDADGVDAIHGAEESGRGGKALIGSIDIAAGGGQESDAVAGPEGEFFGERPGEAEAGAEVVPVDILLFAGIAVDADEFEASAEIGQARGPGQGRGGIGIEVAEAVEAFPAGSLDIPADTEVEGEAAIDADIVLQKEGLIKLGGSRWLEDDNIAAGGIAKHEAGEGVAACAGLGVGAAGKAIVEGELAGGGGVVDPIGAINARVGAELERVAAADLVEGAGEGVDFGDAFEEVVGAQREKAGGIDARQGAVLTSGGEGGGPAEGSQVGAGAAGFADVALAGEAIAEVD